MYTHTIKNLKKKKGKFFCTHRPYNFGEGDSCLYTVPCHYLMIAAHRQMIPSIPLCRQPPTLVMSPLCRGAGNKTRL